MMGKFVALMIVTLSAVMNAFPFARMTMRIVTMSTTIGDTEIIFVVKDCANSAWQTATVMATAVMLEVGGCDGFVLRVC